MLAMDIVSSLPPPLCAVSDNLSILQERPSPLSPSRTLSLPDFLSQLQEQGRLPEAQSRAAGEEEGVVEKCCEMYNSARHKDGVSKIR